ncbi:MAG TPA: ABC transporter permease [Fulvivirga sp.]|nr:ABC transporter permease [Fulvivirga sp.]
MTLTEEHINYIIKDIAYRGIVDEDLGEELVDHICSLVEGKMETGMRFIEAYDLTIKGFGSESRLQELQDQTIKYSNNNTKIMVKNYFKIAFRNLVNHKFYSAINITGLGISMACCILISLFVIDELSYDKFYTDADRIYRINSDIKFGENEFHFAVAPAPMGPALLEEIPEIESVVRFRSRGTYLVRTAEAVESIKENNLIFADPSFFTLFGIDMVEGNAKDALTEPMSIAISQSIAKKYFQQNDPLGQILILDGDNEFHVTAVYQDIPDNSHFKFDFIMPLETLEVSKDQIWVSNNYFTYFKVREGVNPNQLDIKINKMVEAHVAPQVKQFTGNTMDEFHSAGNYMDYKSQPLSKIYLHSPFNFDIGKTGDITYVYLFLIIAIFILVIACINFMNLSTARSANRAKEVGVRKVLGSYKSHLVRQFLTESILISLVAFLFSIVVVNIALPFFNELSGKSLSIPFNQPLYYLVFIATALFIGFLAGVYPAFFLSSFRPVNVLKGKLSLGSKSGLVRSGLVIFQFAISIILLIGTVTVYRQLQFIQNKKLGFNKEQVLLINDSYMLDDKLQSFKDEILKIANVKSATISGYLPVSGYNRSDQTYWPEGKEPSQDNLISMQNWKVDEDYLKTMGMELVWGRNFNKNLASDSNAVILNEKALTAFNLDNKNGTILTFDFNSNTGDIIPNQYIKYHVIGVVKDFNYESMTQPIGNLSLHLGRSSSTMAVRLNTVDFQESINSITAVWKEFAPELALNYKFLDSAFEDMYRSEKRLASVFTVFAGLAIFIGCLGLFALAAFMADQRTKEIGIRKVMGASVKTIVFMLSKEFSKLIILSFIIATPLAWWGVTQWLSKYSYKIDFGVEVYILSGLLAFIIAWLTVGYQSIKAAISNPVDSLRSE